MDKKQKIEELIKQLNDASEAYYNGKSELMSNYEWDSLFNDLLALEEQTGIILPNSPTQKVSADHTKGKKETHEFPALSLDKTKSVDALIKWADSRDICMSWKLDGLTLVASYNGGKLTKLMTRGNGAVGTNITWMAEAIDHLPLNIEYKGYMVVRGEALISYEDFARINAEIENEDEKYANPRNLASGTFNLDDLDEIKKRHIQFIAFTLVYIDEELVGSKKYNMNYWANRMDYLKSDLGFKTVDFQMGDPGLIPELINNFTDSVSSFEFPVDGLVICYNDWAYSQTGSVTGHHATRAGYAFKWKDEAVETVLKDVIYETTRTGIISEVAVFEPVKLCGTTVTRALIPNLNYRKDLDLKIGDRISVIKANMIIPQITKNLDALDRKVGIVSDVKRYNLPLNCPCCGGNVGINISDSGTMNLICTNPMCSAKQIKAIAHFCEKDCMDIDGLSEAKIEFLVNHKYIENPTSLYHMLNEYKVDGMITNMFGESLALFDGWGEKSVANMMNAIEKSRKTTFIKFIHAMGIPNVGKGQAKLLAPAIIKWTRENPTTETQDNDNLVNALCAMVRSGYDFTQIDGFGPVIANSLTKWVNEWLVDAICCYQPICTTWVNELMDEVEFIDTYADYVKDTSDSPINGKTFVITGDVHIYKNRKELQAKIEALGGKVTGSVTKKTDYLINNDVTSTSGKNKKAAELGIQVISEETFEQMI